MNHKKFLPIFFVIIVCNSSILFCADNDAIRITENARLRFENTLLSCAISILSIGIGIGVVYIYNQHQENAFLQNEIITPFKSNLEKIAELQKAKTWLSLKVIASTPEPSLLQDVENHNSKVTELVNSFETIRRKSRVNSSLFVPNFPQKLSNDAIIATKELYITL